MLVALPSLPGMEIRRREGEPIERSACWSSCLRLPKGDEKTRPASDNRLIATIATRARDLARTNSNFKKLRPVIIARIPAHRDQDARFSEAQPWGTREPIKRPTRDGGRREKARALHLSYVSWCQSKERISGHALEMPWMIPDTCASFGQKRRTSSRTLRD